LTKRTKAAGADKAAAVKRAMGRQRDVDFDPIEDGEGAPEGQEDMGGPPMPEADDPGAIPDDDSDAPAQDDDDPAADALDQLDDERRFCIGECAQLDPNDRDNGRRLVKHFGADMAYVQGMGWLVWSGRFWQRDDGELRIRLLAQELVDLIKLERAFIEYTPGQARLLQAARPRRQIPEEEKTQADRELIKNADSAIAQRSKKRADREKFAIQSGNAGKTGAMLLQAASHRAVEADKLDASRMKFNLRNGTLEFWREPDPDGPAEGDAMVGKFRFVDGHERADLITKMADVDYDENATCPFFETEFLGKLQPDPAIRAFLQVFHAYALLIAGNDEQKVVYHFGTGANGKSAFIEVLGRLAGTYRTVVGPETITGDNQRGGQQASPDIARLHNARLATIEELPKNAPLKEDLIKALTGGTKMTARFLQKDIFEFEPIFTPIMSGNTKPMISGSDYGIWRRLLIVHWGVTIPEGERMIPSMLAAKLDAERSGILNWLVTGLVNYLQYGLEPFIPPSVRQFTEEYRNERDNIGSFVERCISPDPGGEIQAGPLYKLYREWCEMNALIPASQKSFGTRLTDQLGFRKSTGNVYKYHDIKVDTSWRITGDHEIPRNGSTVS
jgi:putative DNA primase/helicase